MTHTSVQILIALSGTTLLGVRHGLDCDHFAALSDLVSMEHRPGHSIQLGLAYIAGHSLVISLLGSLAIGLQLAVPPVADRWMERIVGATLVALSGYILGTLIRTRNHRHFQSRSRMMLLIDGVLWFYNRLCLWLGLKAEEGKIGARYESGRGLKSSFLIGLMHGFGAETPTQLVLFYMTARIGGVALGLAGLLLFIVGMATVNTLVCVVLARLLYLGTKYSAFQRVLSGMTAIYSFVVGVIFLVGWSPALSSLVHW
jgi:high-affinity nickel permease